MIRRKSMFVAAIFSIITLLFMTQGGFGECYALPSTGDNEERIFAQSACAGVSNDPPNPTIFTIAEPRIITKIGTYHWNQASGEVPGTIGLKDENGKVYGPWQAEGKPGQGGVPNAYWIAYLPLGVELPAGMYTILDSSPATWSYTGESENSGIASIVGPKAGVENSKEAPCADTGMDFSPRSPTDIYDAGPGLVPGMYNIWYGKRTSSNIGKPDEWNLFGPVELLGEKFYVFDVTADNLGEANPQMINSMLSDPIISESVVWLKLSTKDAYVVCFDGPIGESLQLAGAWKMSGHQEGFNDWKADLNLKKDNSLEWKETEGANVGGSRIGTWEFDGTVLTLKWISPDGGQTNWISQSITENQIDNGTYTVERAQGGTWSATRVMEGI
jgi:hypothetical protein